MDDLLTSVATWLRAHADLSTRTEGEIMQQITPRTHLSIPLEMKKQLWAVAKERIKTEDRPITWQDVAREYIEAGLKKNPAAPG